MERHKKDRRSFIVCILFLFAAVAFALMLGSYRMSFSEVIQTLLGNGTKYGNFTIFEVRLPRTVLAILVASALGISGCVLQGITGNPLAEPGIIGINSGAALFAVLWISGGGAAYYSAIPASRMIAMPMLAIAGGLFSVSLIYLLAYQKGIRQVRFLLAGIGVNAGISAIIMFYQLNMSKGDFNQVLTWTNGSLWGSSWKYIQIVLPPLILLILFIVSRSRILDAMMLGDELAGGIGVRGQKERIVLFLAAAALASLATAVAGNIAFLGLLGPQIAKRLTASRHSVRLPLAAGISAVILVVADTLARNLFSPLEIPVGILVSIFGVPYFIYLMFDQP